MPSLPRIGDLLVEAGAITHMQLSEALQAQRERGGRLGTNLIELGFIDERKLAAVLARQLSIPAVTSAQLERIDSFTLKLLPARAAERLRAIPLREDKGKLWIAVADPTDPRILEQLEKATGRPIRPMVAPEMMLMAALEKHYGVERKPRAKKAPSRSNLPRVEPPRTLAEIGPITPLSSPLPPSPPRHSGPPPVSIPTYDPIAPSRPSTGELDRVAAYLDEAPLVPTTAPRPGRVSIRELSQQLAAATSQDAVLEAALRFLLQDVQRLAALALRGGRLTGVSGMAVDADRLRAVDIAVDESPRVASVLATSEAWVGRVFPHELGGVLWPLFGARGDAPGVVVPMRINRRPVGAIVGVHASAEALRNKPELDRLAQKLDHALHMVALRRQLLDD